MKWVRKTLPGGDEIGEKKKGVPREGKKKGKRRLATRGGANGGDHFRTFLGGGLGTLLKPGTALGKQKGFSKKKKS